MHVLLIIPEYRMVFLLWHILSLPLCCILPTPAISRWYLLNSFSSCTSLPHWYRVWTFHVPIFGVVLVLRIKHFIRDWAYFWLWSSCHVRGWAFIITLTVLGLFSPCCSCSCLVFYRFRLQAWCPSLLLSQHGLGTGHGGVGYSRKVILLCTKFVLCEMWCWGMKDGSPRHWSSQTSCKVTVSLVLVRAMAWQPNLPHIAEQCI